MMLTSLRIVLLSALFLGWSYAVMADEPTASGNAAAHVAAANDTANDTANDAAANDAKVRSEEAFRLPIEQRPASWTVLSAGDLNVLLERSQDGIRVLSLFDTAKHQQLLSQKPLPLFDIVLRFLEDKQEMHLSAEAGWEQVRATETTQAAGTAQANPATPDKTVELCWQTPKDKRLGDLRVVAVASLDAAAGAICWQLRVENVGRSWLVRSVAFPQIAVNIDGPNAKFLSPCGSGRLISGPWPAVQLYQGTYPSGWAAMQFMAAYDTQLGTGLYCGLHDPFGGTKDIAVIGQPNDKAITFRYSVPAENYTAIDGKTDGGGNGYVLSGEAVWQVLHGDWYDAALIYRAWVRQNAKWFPKLTPEGREDTPLWMRELPVWLMAWGNPDAVVPAAEAFAKAMAMPTGIHWYGWHQIPFDNDYPHYFPTVPGFAEAVQKLQAENVFVMPYINGRLWDTRDKGAEDFEFTKTALPAATKQEDGNPYTEKYGSKEADDSPVTLAVMCPATKLWQETLRGIVLRLMNECGVKAVYIDQIAAAAPVLCADRSHGHPTGGGHWWTESYWTLLDAIRREKPADRIMTTECNGEPFIRCFDGYLTWHWGYDGQVPAFPAIYGGAIQMFGRAYRGGETKDLAFHMKAGQQLVFGEQIGWFGPEIAQDEKVMPFLRQAVGVRWQLRRYFYAGEMARPPKLPDNIPTVRADWQWDNPGWVTTSAVLTGAWALPKEKRCVLLFANVSDQPVTTELKLDATAYGFSNQEIKVTTITASGVGESFTSPSLLQHPITIPAQSAFAWELSAGK
jgi:hypothetical protein